MPRHFTSIVSVAFILQKTFFEFIAIIVFHVILFAKLYYLSARVLLFDGTHGRRLWGFYFPFHYIHRRTCTGWPVVDREIVRDGRRRRRRRRRGRDAGRGRRLLLLFFTGRRRRGRGLLVVQLVRGGGRVHAARLVVRLPVLVLTKRTAILRRVASAARLVRLPTAVPAALQNFGHFFYTRTVSSLDTIHLPLLPRFFFPIKSHLLSQYFTFYISQCVIRTCTKLYQSQIRVFRVKEKLVFACIQFVRLEFFSFLVFFFVINYFKAFIFFVNRCCS